MLKLHNCTVITQKNRILLDHVSFTCLPKDKIAVIGEEGNGKSTLLKVIACPQQISEYARMEGTVDTGGAVIGMLPQTLDPQWEESSGLDFCLCESPQQMAQYEKMGELLQLMEKTGADAELLERSMAVLSGGERVKLQLIRLQLAHPDLILLDEPTNDLDLPTLKLLEQFILESEAAILFVSHDETLLERCATAVLHLEQIKRKTQPRWTFCHLGYRDYLEQRNHLAQRQDQLATKQRQEYQKQQQRVQRLAQNVEVALNSVSRQQPHAAKMLKRKMHSVRALQRRLDEKELTHRFEGEEQIELLFEPDVGIAHERKQILQLRLDELWAQDHLCARNVELSLYGREKTAIIGPNGCGKTTLLKVCWEKLKQRRDLRVGYMPQNYEELLPLQLNPVDYLCGEKDAQHRTRIQNHLGSLKFTPEEMMRPMSDFSSGQKAKVLLVKLVTEKNDVLLLDEPTRNLSPMSARQIRAQLASFPGCILAVSHDRKFLQEVTDRCLRLGPQGLREENGTGSGQTDEIDLYYSRSINRTGGCR